MLLVRKILYGLLVVTLLMEVALAQNLCQIRTVENAGLPGRCVQYWNDVPVNPGEGSCIFDCSTTNTDNPFDLSCARTRICKTYCGLDFTACSDPGNTAGLAQFQEGGSQEGSSDEAAGNQSNDQMEPAITTNNDIDLQNNPDTLLDSDNNFNNPDEAQSELLEDATLLTNIMDKIEAIIDILTQSTDIAEDAACQLSGGDCDAQGEQDENSHQNRESSQATDVTETQNASVNEILPTGGELQEPSRADLVCMDAQLSVILGWFTNPDSPVQVPECSTR